MAFTYQLKGILTKELIQIRRNFLLFLIELLCPIVLIFIFFCFRKIFQVEKASFESANKNNEEFLKQNGTYLTNKINQFNPTYTNRLNMGYKYMLALCGNNSQIALIGNNFPTEIEEKIKEHSWELRFENKDLYLRFENKEEFLEYLKSPKYGNQKPKICFGITYNDNYEFEIHYSSEESEINNNPVIPSSSKEQKLKIKNQQDFINYSLYQSSGYLMIMKILYDYILQQITNNSLAEIDFSVVPMKYENFKTDELENFYFFYGCFLLIGFEMSSIINIYREIHLRQTRQKEYMKIMSLKETVLFLQFFIRWSVVCIVQSIICSLLTRFIFFETNSIYYFFVTLLLGYNYYAIAYLFQIVVDNAALSIILNIFVICTTSSFYGLFYTTGSSNSVIVGILCFFLPPLNLLLGLRTFYCFEDEFTKYNKKNSGDNLELISVNQLFGNFVGSCILYLFLGIYINQVRMNTEKIKNGDNNYNLFSRKFWGCVKKKHKKKEINEQTEVKNVINNGNNDNNDNDNNDNNDESNDTNNDDNIDNDNDNDNNENNEPRNDRAIVISKHKKSLAEDLKSSVRSNQKAAKYQLYKSINELEEIEEEINPNVNKNIALKASRLGLKSNISQEEEELYDQQEMNFQLQVNSRKIKQKRSRILSSSIYQIQSKEEELNSIKNNDLKTSFLLYNQYKSHKSGAKKTDSISTMLFSYPKKLKDNVVFEKNEIKLDYDALHSSSDLKIEIKNLKMIYPDGKNALKGISFNMYENEIFVILGQNGAGKSTFISILSGLLTPTSGEIIYYEKNKKPKNILSSLDKFDYFRTKLGICPQQNLIFNDLTVREHLELFSLIKKQSSENDKEIEEEMEELLTDFDLKEKENFLAGKLSGGQKRKLSIALACCAGSKVIILDEPTGGMDVGARRDLWDVLKKYKKNRILILITHFMEEATALSDRICIFSNGKIVALDTCMNLIDKYGQFLTLKINKKSKANNEEIIDKVFEAMPLALSNNIGLKDKTDVKIFNEEIKFRFPKSLIDFSRIQNFLEEIESKKKMYKINNYYLSMCQLEDVFLNLMKKNNPENNDKKNKKDNKDKFNPDTYLDSQKFRIKRDCASKFAVEFKIIYKKRIYGILRNKVVLALEIIFPLVLTFFSALCCFCYYYPKNESFNIKLGNVLKDPITIFYSSPLQDSRILFENPIYDSENQKTDITFKNINLDNNINDLDTILSNKKNINTVNCASYYISTFDTSENKYEFTVYINTISKQSAIIYPSYLMQNILLYKNRDKQSKKINIINSPFPRQKASDEFKKMNNGIVVIIFFSIAIGFIPGSFVATIIREKENASKHLQITSGISLITYWVSNFFFDLTIYYIVLGICIIILIIFHFFSKYFFIFYLTYGPPMIVFTYVIGMLCKNEGFGQILIMLINIVFGALLSSSTFLLRKSKKTKSTAIIISYILSFIPSYGFTYGYSLLLCKEVIFMTDFEDDYAEKLKDEKLMLRDKDYILVNLIFMGVDFVLYIIIMIILENNQKCTRQSKNKIQNELPPSNNRQKSEVSIESHRENSMGIGNINNNNDLASNEQFKNRKIENKKPILINSLKKTYKLNFIYKILNLCCKNKFKNYEGLKGVSFDLQYGECFGLLGLNGAGKSTMFKCISKVFPPTDGNIIIEDKIINNDDFNIITDANQDKLVIGYCPQFDAIFEHLTVKENLKYYCMLKGVDEKEIDNVIKSLILEMDLTVFENKISGNLSGGNKRKLSVAIAIICSPIMLLMDEPTTGMDPYTRTILLKVLYKLYLNSSSSDIKTKGSIIMTTHSIEEAESLCHKIGILIHGQFICQGSVNELVEKYGKDIEVSIEIRKPNPIQIMVKYKLNDNILREKVNTIEEIIEFLKYMNKNDLIKYLKKSGMGRDLLITIDNLGETNKYTILRWIYFIENLMGFVKKLGKYFSSVTIIDFSINNFVLNVKGNDDTKNSEKKSNSFIFGIIESNKELFNIIEYNCKFNTLEEIFIDLTHKKVNENQEKIEIAE